MNIDASVTLLVRHNLEGLEVELHPRLWWKKSSYFRTKVYLELELAHPSETLFSSGYANVRVALQVCQKDFRTA